MSVRDETNDFGWIWDSGFRISAVKKKMNFQLRLPFERPKAYLVIWLWTAAAIFLVSLMRSSLMFSKAFFAVS